VGAVWAALESSRTDAPVALPSTGDASLGICTVSRGRLASMEPLVLERWGGPVGAALVGGSAGRGERDRDRGGLPGCCELR
jgi:hypothetical protein